MRHAIKLGVLVSALAFSQLNCGSNNSAPPPQAGQTPSPSPSPVAVPFPVPVPVPIPYPVPVPAPHRWLEAHEEIRANHDVQFSVFPDGTFRGQIGNDPVIAGRVTANEFERIDAISSTLADRDLNQRMNCFRTDVDQNSPETLDEVGLADGVRYPVYLVVPASGFVCLNGGTNESRSYHGEMQSLTNKYLLTVMPTPTPTPSMTITPTPSPSPSSGT